MTETTTTAKPSILTIDKVLYNVDSCLSPEDHEANGHFNIAREMRNNGITLDFHLSRPRGRKTYIAVQYVSGNYSTATALSWV